MAELKTKPTRQSVETFVDKVESERVRDDCYKLIGMFTKITGFEPVMWGPSIIGFGSYRYRYESGREGEMCMVGFSPRKPNLTLYITSEKGKKLLPELGKCKTSKACLYIKKLDDIDLKVLERMIKLAIESVQEKHAQS